MARAAVIAACSIAFSGAAACAQTPELDSLRVQMLEQQLESARLQALDAQRAAYAAQAQLRTEQAVQALEAGRNASTVTGPDPLPYSIAEVPAAARTPVAPIVGQQASDSDRLLELQAEALARSNARILAVKPAL